MNRLLALLLVTTGILAVMLGGTPVAAASPVKDMLFNDRPAATHYVEASIDQFAGNNGLPTVEFVNLAAGQEATSECGITATSDFAYFFCPIDNGGHGLAFIGLDMQTWIADGTHYLAPYIAIAHEWGHKLQLTLTPHAYGQQLEDGADCVGGAWLRWFNDREGLGLSIADLIPLYGLATKIEKQYEGDVHGTRLDRGVAMLNGYLHGVASCNWYTPTVPVP